MTGVDFYDTEDSDLELEPAGYQSPVLSRMSSSAKLTLQFLREEVPVYRAGREAAERLGAEDVDADEVDELNHIVFLGEAAKERLVVAGVPLIRHLAQKEARRRSAWQSQIHVDDLFQDGVAGFLKGLRVYDPDGSQRSATNYLGQWIQVEMRRNNEAADNDFGVPHETSERFRKIRALRSRLIAENNREPTPEEVVEASLNPLYRGGANMGRVKKSPGASRRQLTVDQVLEEQEFRNRVGFTSRFDMTDSSGEDSISDVLDVSSSARVVTDDSDSSDDVSVIVEVSSAEASIRGLVRRCLEVMNLREPQKEIISRKWGLPPYTEEEAPKEIAAKTGVPRDRVAAVVDGFSREMRKPGGVFHKVCCEAGEDALFDAGLGWVMNALGSYEDAPERSKRGDLPKVLTTELPVKGKPRPVRSDLTRLDGFVKALFECEYHGNEFAGAYPDIGSVARERACPQCGRLCALKKVVQG